MNIDSVQHWPGDFFLGSAKLARHAFTIMGRIAEIATGTGDFGRQTK